MILVAPCYVRGLISAIHKGICHFIYHAGLAKINTSESERDGDGGRGSGHSTSELLLLIFHVKFSCLSVGGQVNLYHCGGVALLNGYVSVFLGHHLSMAIMQQGASHS